MRAAVYCRISSDPDGEQEGVARQREDCLSLVEREGWELVEVYVDNAVSAYNGAERPAWRRLLEACVEGRVDVVVAWRDDRLWRDVVEERQVSAMLAEEGVERIAFASGRTYDPSDVDDRLTSGLHALVAEHESAVKAVRVRRALEQRAAEGKRGGGPVPFGYRAPTETELATGVAQEGGLVVVPDEAEVVREAARRVLAGEALAAVGRGFSWSGTRVRQMLENPTYAGLLRFRGEVVGEGRWEAVLTRGQHEALVAMLDGRRNGPGRPPTRLLTGTLTCYKCGEGMRGTVTRGKRRYHCRSDTGCGGPSVSGDPTDAYVTDLLLTALADSRALAERLSASTSANVTEVSEDLTADERRLEELVADYYCGDVPKGAYLTARQRLEARIEEARGTLAAAQIDSAPQLPVGDRTALDSWWAEATVSQRRALLSVVVDRVELKPWEARMGRKFSPDRLQVVWA